jgi:SAM-dependent methyltransferase
MDQTKASRSPQYDSNYGNFQRDLYAEIRREAFGEDIGQNSWLTAGEHDKFLAWLGAAAGKDLLDVACGAGGPAMRATEVSGCRVTGVDVHEQAIAAAQLAAAQRGIKAAQFQVVDASKPLPFADATFDAICCIDAINHFPDRAAAIADWSRLLKPRGRMLFTDPITVTGPLSNAEVAARSSSGFYLFVPPGYDEKILEQCSVQVVVTEDHTENMATIADRRRSARQSRAEALRKIEGDTSFEEQQLFLATCARLAAEKRLSRFVFVAEKSH